MDVNDFGKSWRSGLAFLALVKSINPAMVDLRESFHRDPLENVRQAFMIAHHSLDIPPLLEPEGKRFLIVGETKSHQVHFNNVDYDPRVMRDFLSVYSKL